MKPFLARLAARELPWVAALAFLATYGFFCEYLPPMERVHIYSDIEGYHFPLQRYAFQSLKEGRFPEWDPSIYCGVSFVGNVQAALLYPPSWVMYAASWRRLRIKFKMLEDFVFVHIWLAYVLCYVWLRGRRLGKLASALGAGVFAFGGYMASQCVHVGVATGLTWMPLGLWGIDQAVEFGGWRPLWKTALASALCFLAGYPPTWIVFCVTTLVYALASRAHWRAALGVCGALAASVLLAMAQWWPMLEASSLSALSDKYGSGVYNWRAMIPYFVPNWFDANRGSTAPYPADTVYLYLGLPALFAVGWAVRRGAWRPYVQPLAAALVCLAIATNPGWLVYNLMVRVPLLERSVQSYNFYEGVAAMAALITALSLDDFLGRARSGALASISLPARWSMPVATAALAGWAMRQWWIWGHGGRFATGGRALAETALALTIFSGGMWVLRAETGARRAWLAAALLLMAFADYKVFGANRRFNTVDGDVDKLQNPIGIHGMNLTAYWALWTNRQFRIASDERGGPSSTDYRMWGLATPLGFDPFLPWAYHQFIQQWVPFDSNREFRMDVRNERMLRELGVRYVITHEGAAHADWLAANPAFHRLGPDDSFYRVYEFLRAKAPYGWVDGSGPDGNEDARPVGWLPERRVFQVDSGRGGRFFLAEQFLPGWSASVDGRPAALERWNRVFQAIAVEPGAHTVVFEYRSRGLLPGAAIGIAAAAALALVAGRKPKSYCKPR
jgi:hypothetical protein